MSSPLWTPDPERRQRSGYAAFARRLGASCDELPEAALADLDRFWDEVWLSCAVQGERGPGPAYVAPKAGDDPRGARFFPAPGSAMPRICWPAAGGRAMKPWSRCARTGVVGR